MSETMGRCEGAVMAACEARGGQIASSPYGERRAIAAAIDRLAADVAEVKAKVDAISPDDVAHLVECERAWVRLVEEKRDAAIRERDQWREEARLAVVNRDDARAEVERLKAIVHSDAGHMAKILIENERLRAAPAAPQPAGQGISPKVADTQPTGNAAPAAGWLTERERGALSRAFDLLCDDDGDNPLAGTVQALLSRAGSPPVVVLPTVFARSLLGDELVALQQVKDALDKAGVAWKEV